MQSFKSYCFSEPTLITTPKRLLHGATANLTPTVLPPYKASNPTASQNQHLLQLLRDCTYMVLLQTLLLLYFHHTKLQILLLLRTNNYYNSTIDCLHGATSKPYSYCTSTMQSFKSYCFSEPTIITTPKRLLHGATANLTPTVLPPYKASNPTASQQQHLLQLPRDCLHGATANLTPTVLPPCKASNPTASQNQQLLQLLRDCYMVLLQTLLLLYFHHAKLQILLLLRTNTYYNSQEIVTWCYCKPYSYCTSTMQSFKSYCFSVPTLITTPKRLLHGATANLTPTVLPPCKASNPTASQNQHLLQLLRDCYMVLPSKPYSYCTSTMQSFKSYCFSEPTIITTPKRLYLHGATSKPYSYCTSTMQSFKSYCFSEPTAY